MKLPSEYLITFLLSFPLYSTFQNSTHFWRTIHTEGMGKIVTNIFETNYCTWYRKEKCSFLGFGIIIFSYDIERYVSNGQAYDNILVKKDWKEI
jgi:hypothetical protein